MRYCIDKFIRQSRISVAESRIRMVRLLIRVILPFHVIMVLV